MGQIADFILTDGTTTLPLMLSRRKGERLYRIDDASPISPRILTEGQLTQAELSYPYAVYNYEEDWRKGMGGVTHRLHLGKYATGSKIDASVQGVIRPAQELRTMTVDAVPTVYAPSGGVITGTQLWLFIGGHNYSMNLATEVGTRGTFTRLAPGNAIPRNGVQLDDITYVPVWADDVGSGGSYVAADRPTLYVHKASAATSWTTVDGAGATTREAFKFFAVANGLLWGAYTTQWAASGLNYEASPRICAVGHSGQLSNVASYTASYNAGAATDENRCLVVYACSQIDAGSAADPTGITYGGVALTLHTTSTNPGTQVVVSVWYLVAPATGSNSLVVTWAGAQEKRHVTVYSLSNVDQTTPIRDTTALSSDASASLAPAATSVDNDLVLDYLGNRSGTTVTVGAGQTSRVASTGSFNFCSSVEEATGVSTTMGWSWTGAGRCVCIAASVAPVAVSGTTLTNITTTGTPSSQFAAGDVLRFTHEYLLCTAVVDADFASAGHGYITVLRAYRGTVAETQASPAALYEATERPHHVHSTSDGTTLASWSTATAVGDASAPITALVGMDTDLVVLKADGLYRLESNGTVTNLRPELSTARLDTQFRGAYGWNDMVMLPTAKGGLWVLDTITWALKDISFSLTMPKQTQFHGPVVALAGTVDTLFALVHDSANLKYYLLKGVLDSERELQWHCVAERAYVTGTDENHVCLFLEGVTSGVNTHHRVWMGVESTGSNLLFDYYPISTKDDDWGYTNDTDAVIQFLAVDKGLPNVPATWASVDFQSTANLGAGGRKWAIEHRIDAGSWLTTLTDAAGNADGIVDVSPSQTLTFPAGTTGNILELRAKPALTTVGTTPPELGPIRVTNQIRPTRLVLLPVTFYLAVGQMRSSGVFRGSPVKDLAQLETWAGGARELTVTDPRRTSRQMQIFPGSLRILPLTNWLTRRPEYEVSLLFSQV